MTQEPQGTPLYGGGTVALEWPSDGVGLVTTALLGRLDNCAGG